MGRLLVQKMLPTLNKMQWPATLEATQLGREAYEVGLEKVDDFKDDPKPLASALRTFQSGQSLPYAYAGASYALLRASREKDGSYAQVGLDASLEWLERAQELTPDAVEINMIEAFIYTYGGRYSDARLILDYLEEIDPTDYHVLTAEVAYWQEQGKGKETVHWYKQAMSAADTVPRKLRLYSKLGDFYLANGQYDEALEVYKEMVHFSKDNPWLWHNMSVAYWHKEQLQEADRCNKRALALRDLPEAHKMELALSEQLESGGLVSRLFGR